MSVIEEVMMLSGRSKLECELYIANIIVSVVHDRLHNYIWLGSHHLGVMKPSILLINLSVVLIDDASS